MNFDDFLDQLLVFNTFDILFLALGNEQRGDDEAGIRFAKMLLQTREFSKSKFIFAYTTPENYLQQIIDENPKVVICIDSARLGHGPGDIFWIEATQLDSSRISTHAFSIKLVEKYLNEFIPLEFRYLGIEPFTTELGTGLSSFVLSSFENFFSSSSVLN